MVLIYIRLLKGLLLKDIYHMNQKTDKHVYNQAQYDLALNNIIFIGHKH